MDSKTIILKKALILLLPVFMFCIYHIQNNTAYGAQSLDSLHPAEIKSVEEIKKAVLLISQNQKEALNENKMSFDFQKLLLTKSSECLNTLVALQSKSPPKSNEAKQEEKEIFLNLRDILKQILTLNEKIIWDIQENTLDKLNDPSAFIKSAKWQDPQYLISLSSYWMGWNGYYTSMLLSESDPMHDTVLNEAIKGFSRSFIDFEEEAVTTRSLLGRALCYGKQKAYDRAGQDLKLVKKKIGKDDPLYIRCLYEEVRMIYETGNYEKTIRTLNELKEDYPEEKIPEQIGKALDKIKFKALVAVREKQEKKNTKKQQLSQKTDSKMFEELRKLGNNPNGADELYRYVQENTSGLEGLSYAELGPVAAMALGDLMFEKKDYDKALKYYLPIFKDSNSFMAHRMDGLWFRTANIYCKKEQYGDAVYYLEKFHIKFPDSGFLSQSISLYYAAATLYYNKEKSQKAYNTYIDAVSIYIKSGGNSPDMSEAFFRMGKHYQKTGKSKEAADMFLKVKTDSPNYASAKYYLLQYYVDQLKILEKHGRHHSQEAKKIYLKGDDLITAYRKAGHKAANAVYASNIEAHMIILESAFRLYGPDADMKKSLEKLKDFERRFPKDNNLLLKAFQLKMITYQHFGMLADGDKELRKFTSVNSPDDDAYAVLSNLAEKFDNETQSRMEEKTKIDASYYSEFALMTYKGLYKISCDKAKHLKYCDIAQLGMARIYTGKNQLDEAIAVYRDIIKRNSLSADAIYNLGLLYDKSKQWQNSLATWRKFSDGVKSGTYHWFESRYKIAYALAELGENAKACEVLKITLVLHPDLGSDELKEKYLALKAKICKEEPPS